MKADLSSKCLSDPCNERTYLEIKEKEESECDLFLTLSDHQLQRSNQKGKLFKMRKCCEEKTHFLSSELVCLLIELDTNTGL